MAGSEELMFANPLVASGLTPLAEDADGEEWPPRWSTAYGTYLDELAKQPGGQEIRDLAAMSVIDGDAMATLDAAMQSFSDAAVAHMDEIATQVARARADALEFVVGLPGSDGVPWDLVDLGDFLRHLTDVPDDVAVARDAVFAALQNAVSHQLTRHGHPAGDRPQRLPADRRERAVRRRLLRARRRAAGLGGLRRGLPRARQPAAASEPGGGVRFASQQATVLQADPAGSRSPASSVSGDSSQVTESETQIYTRIGDRDGALGVVLPGLPRRRRRGPGPGCLGLLADRAHRRAEGGRRDGGLPGPGRRSARHLAGPVHLARRRRLRRRDQAAAQQPGRDRERPGRRRVQRRAERRRRHPRGRRPADALPLRPRVRAPSRASCPRSRSR